MYNATASTSYALVVVVKRCAVAGVALMAFAVVPLRVFIKTVDATATFDAVTQIATKRLQRYLKTRVDLVLEVVMLGGA
jgi:hypothetical protein